MSLEIQVSDVGLDSPPSSNLSGESWPMLLVGLNMLSGQRSTHSGQMQEVLPEYLTDEGTSSYAALHNMDSFETALRGESKRCWDFRSPTGGPR